MTQFLFIGVHVVLNHVHKAKSTRCSIRARVCDKLGLPYNLLLSYIYSSPVGDVTLKATAEVNTKYLVYITSQDNGATTRTSVNNLALRIDTFDPAVNAISFVLSTSKTYFQALQENFENELALVYRTVYPSAVVRVWCIEERDGVANDDTLGRRRRLLATGYKIG